MTPQLKTLIGNK
nr:unnamed protein product [Callosobruchus analis]CAI5865994.1 unnamed protein product [Callosobruchus analis]